MACVIETPPDFIQKVIEKSRGNLKNLLFVIIFILEKVTVISKVTCLHKPSKT